MKIIAYLAGLCFLAAACNQSPDRFKLTGSGISSSNDLYVYDVAENSLIDTIKVENGTFTYINIGIDEPKLLILTNKQDFLRYMIAEKGNLTLTGDTSDVRGTPLNDRLADFMTAYRNAGSQLEEEKSVLFQNMEKGEVGVTEEDAIAQLQMLEKKQMDLLADLVKKHYEKDKGNLLGVLQLIILQGLVADEEFALLYEQGGEIAKRFPPFMKLFEAKEAIEKTKVGEKYIDFEGVNPSDTTQRIKLSDFMGKGDYVLLDFWASWCGPCRKSMPELKALNDNYANRGLKVIGVVVSDKIQNHLKAAAELDVTWTQIFDNKDNIGSLYGLKGIPTLILLDKDGTIRVRTHEKEDVVKEVQKLLGK